MRAAQLLALGSLIAARVASGADCNSNGTPDIEEIRSGALPDCNTNGIPDACDLEPVNYGLVAGERFFLGRPAELIVQDIDGDARPEVIGAHTDTNIVSVLWNDGRGSFAPVVHRVVAEPARAIVPIDIDGDGSLELAVGGTGGLSILFQDPTTPVPFIPLDSPIAALTSGDFDGDSHVDLAAAVPLGVRILQNEGNASFVPLDIIPLGSNPVGILAASLDGDGDLDLVTANRIDGPLPAGNVSVLIQRGNGSFDTARNFAANQDPLGLLSGDLDGDGDADLAVASVAGGEVTVLLGDGQGRFELSRRIEAERRLTSMTSGDLDGDGNIDVAVSGLEDASGVAAFLNLGAADFGHRVKFRTTQFECLSIRASDLEGDGLVEVVASTSSSNMRVLEGTRAAASMDCNSNNRPDDCELSGNDCNRNEIPDTCDVLSGASPDCNQNGIPDECDTPGGVFAFETSFIHTFSPTRLLSSSDLDVDGQEDIHGVSSSGDLVVFWNAGAAGFLRESPLRVGSTVADSVAGDLDGDGDQEIVFAEPGDRGLRILESLGNRTFAEGATISVPGGAALVAAGDLDGDLDLDLASTTSDGRVVVFENRGGGAFGGPLPLDGKSSNRFLEVSDIDGDGLTDLALAGGLHVGDLAFMASVTVFWNKGALAFWRGNVLEPGFVSFDAVVADADGDGDRDILSLSVDRLLLFRKAGGRTFAFEDLASPTVFQDLGRMIAGDLDRDGDEDLAVVFGTRLTTLSSRGDGKFGPPVVISTFVDSSKHPVSGDWNGDGSLDLAVASGARLIVLTNVTTPPVSRDADTNGVPDECQQRPFHRGDADGDGLVNLTDAVFTLGHLFRGEPAPACLEAADANNDARVEITDPIATLEFLFRGGTAPAPPGAPPAACGLDTDASGSAGDIGCGAYGACGV